jgi:hypothetical protein
MEQYKIHVYFRHYVHNEDTLARYKRIVNRVNRATKLADFVFNVFVNYDPEMPQKLKDEINAISMRLIENNVDFSVKVARGAGVALFNIIEESLSNMSVDRDRFFIVCVDGDSYAIDNIRFLRQIRKMCDDMLGEGALLGLAQRTKILLPGSDESYREIGEMFLALSMAGKLPVKKSVLLKVPPAYAELGDPVPGFYCLNMNHPRILELYHQMEQDMLKANLAGYAGDCYFVLAASQLGKLLTEIVPLEDNPLGSFSLEDGAIIAREIGKTTMRKVYLAAIKSEDNMKILEKYYPRDTVEKVRDNTLKAMLRI